MKRIMKIVVFSILSLQLFIPLIFFIPSITSETKREMSNGSSFPEGARAQAKYIPEPSSDFIFLINGIQLGIEVIMLSVLFLFFVDGIVFVILLIGTIRNKN